MEQKAWPSSEQQSGFIQGAWKWASVNEEVGGLFIKQHWATTDAALIWNKSGKQKKWNLAKKTNLMNKEIKLFLGRFQDFEEILDRPHLFYS